MSRKNKLNSEISKEYDSSEFPPIKISHCYVKAQPRQEETILVEEKICRGKHAKFHNIMIKDDEGNLHYTGSYNGELISMTSMDDEEQAEYENEITKFMNRELKKSLLKSIKEYLKKDNHDDVFKFELPFFLEILNITLTNKDVPLNGHETQKELLDILSKKVEDKQFNSQKQGRDIIITGFETDEELYNIIHAVDEEDERDQN